MNHSTHSGFSLIELLVALAVSAILLGIGIPSFSGAIKNSQVSSDYNGLIKSLYLARSEAVKTNERITVCPRTEPDSELCGSNLNDWKHGWLVFMDLSPSNGDDVAVIGPEDEIIYMHDEQRSDNTILASGSTDRTKTTARSRHYIQYRQFGTADWANGTIELCNAEVVDLSRAINVAPTGDVRPGRPSGSDYPRDVFGDEICL